MDTAKRVKDFARKYELTYLQLLDDNQQTFRRYVEVGVVPRTLLLDRDMKITWMELGYTQKKLDSLVAAVESLLAPPVATSVSGPAVR